MISQDRSPTNDPNDPQPSFRLTSIECLDQYGDQFRQVASDHGFDLELQNQEKVNAPFCGIDYYCQEMKLQPASQANNDSDLRECIQAIEHLAETSFADGYVEVLR